MENTQTNRPTYKEIFGDILKKAGFEGTAEDGFTKEQDIVTGTMIINGRPVQQKEHSKTSPTSGQEEFSRSLWVPA